jgi:diacylglycerol kinase family enzyme
VIIVLLNRQAGQGRAAALEAPMRAALATERPDVSFTAPNDLAEARALVMAWPPGTRVVVVGGDGTVHHLLSALMHRRCELALVPAGSGDDTARALGVRGLHWRHALQQALLAPARRIDLGEVRTEHERRPFISSVNVGFDAAVAQRAFDGPAWLPGQARYVGATLREVVGLQSHRLHIALDGRVLHDGQALFASVLNTPTYGGGLPAVPNAHIDDGRLNLLLASGFSRAGVLGMLPRLMAGQHLGDPRVATTPFETLSVRGQADLPLAADGEPLRPVREVEIEVWSGVLPAVVS